MSEQTEILQAVSDVGTSQASSSLPAAEQRDAEDRLKAECRDLWNTLQLVQEKLRQESSVQGVGDGDPKVMTLAQKEKALRAELSVLEQKTPAVYPSDGAVLEALLLDELQTNVAQQQDTLTYVKTQLNDIKENIKREESFVFQHQQIHESLLQKVNTEQENQDQADHRGTNLLKELQTRKGKIDEYRKEIMVKMKAFIVEHYPTPTDEELVTWYKKKSLPKPKEQILSLTKMLEILMNSCLEKPHDPYIELTDGCWPPYVELLLRSGIALRHPERNNRLKLTPFHL